MSAQRFFHWRGFAAILALAFAGILAAAPAHAQKRILIGSTSTSSGHYGFWVALSQLINEKVPGVNATTVETGASVDNMRRADRGQLDMGLSSTTTLHQGHHGTIEAFKTPIKLGLMFVYSVVPQTVVVRADSGVTTLEGLNGKRFNPGIKGSSTESTSEQVFKILGIEPDYVRGSTTDIGAAIKDNRVVGNVKSAASLILADASTVDLATFTPVRFIGVTPAQAAKLRKELPEMGVFTAEMTNIAGKPKFDTWGFGATGFASLKLDEDTVYRISKAVFEDTTVLAAAFNGLKGAEILKYTLELGNTPLHPGTARYLREKGHSFGDDMKPAS